MNTDPKAIKVLCYGDSNTWGQKDDKSGRYPADVRWTGLLQKELGNDFYVIEEGLGGRTTDLEHSSKPGRNGLAHLEPVIESHNPIDVLVIMLGTNDLKTEFDRPVGDIAAATKRLLEVANKVGIDRNGKPPKVILVSPIHVDDNAPRFSEFYTGKYDSQSAAKSQELAKALQQVAEEHGCYFIDASGVATPGTDGVHFSEDAHRSLSPELIKLVRKAVESGSEA